MNADVLECENAFEAFCKWHSHEAHNCHHYNGHFADNMFLNDVAKQKKIIGFCGVNTHHQNGLSEKIICELQEQARMILLDAHIRWAQAIYTSLWPYAMRAASNVRNIMLPPGSTKS